MQSYDMATRPTGKQVADPASSASGSMSCCAFSGRAFFFAYYFYAYFYGQNASRPEG